MSLMERCVAAFEARCAHRDARGAPLVDEAHVGAFRLLNGYSEGAPGVVVEVFGRTAVVLDHREAPEARAGELERVASSLVAAAPWLSAVLWKARRASSRDHVCGRWLRGGEPGANREITEAGVRYAVALRLHQDATLYLDTRELRAWLRRHLVGRTLLNTFAYTGSLGVAARAAGARRVVQIDRNVRYLEIARRSYALNGLESNGRDLVAEDVFRATARLRREGQLFDVVVLDPPVFSETAAGSVDLEREHARLIDKVRPLVGDGGALVVVQNALFVSGEQFLGTLSAVTAGGYARLEELVGVPEDVRGLLEADVGVPAVAGTPADPRPFVHPTKIAVLRVRRKDGRRAT